MRGYKTCEGTAFVLFQGCIGLVYSSTLVDTLHGASEKEIMQTPIVNYWLHKLPYIRKWSHSVPFKLKKRFSEIPGSTKFSRHNIKNKKNKKIKQNKINTAPLFLSFSNCPVGKAGVTSMSDMCASNNNDNNNSKSNMGGAMKNEVGKRKKSIPVICQPGTFVEQSRGRLL